MCCVKLCVFTSVMLCVHTGNTSMDAGLLLIMCCVKFCVLNVLCEAVCTYMCKAVCTHREHQHGCWTVVDHVLCKVVCTSCVL